MMRMTNFESQFVDSYREVEYAVMAGDYEKAIHYVRIAGECCKKLYEEALDVKTKDKWKNNAEKLQKIYNDCKTKMQEKDPNYVVPKEEPKKPVSKAIKNAFLLSRTTVISLTK